MTLAAAAAAGSGVLGQLLGTDWLLNPLAWTGHATPGLMERMQRFALIAGGPCRLALLAAAMLAVLRILRKFGFWVRPSAADRAVFGIFCLFTLCRFCEAGAASLAGSRIGFEEWVSLAGLPILCVLFLEAMLLRQAVGRMGNGLIARGWLALVCGILLTGAGEAARWVIPHYSQSLPLAAFAALIQLSAGGGIRAGARLPGSGPTPGDRTCRPPDRDLATARSRAGAVAGSRRGPAYPPARSSPAPATHAAT